MNKKLIAKVIQSIQNQPEKHDQNSWVRIDSDDRTLLHGLTPQVPITNLLELEGACETSACIAGWALLHEGYMANVPGYDHYGSVRIITVFDQDGNGFSSDGVGKEAAELLGIQDLSYGQLFYDMHEDGALAQLVYLHENGDLPEIEYVGEEGYDFLPEDIQDYDRDDLRFDGMVSENFINTWLAVANEKFPPAPQPAKTN